MFRIAVFLYCLPLEISRDIVFFMFDIVVVVCLLMNAIVVLWYNNVVMSSSVGQKDATVISLAGGGKRGRERGRDRGGEVDEGNLSVEVCA